MNCIGYILFVVLSAEETSIYMVKILHCKLPGTGKQLSTFHMVSAPGFEMLTLEVGGIYTTESPSKCFVYKHVN